MLTVREACALIKFYADGKDTSRNTLRIAADGCCKDFCPENGIELAAYGDFVISEISIGPDSVDLEIKREFVKAVG